MDYQTNANVIGALMEFDKLVQGRLPERPDQVGGKGYPVGLVPGRSGKLPKLQMQQMTNEAGKVLSLMRGYEPTLLAYCQDRADKALPITTEVEDLVASAILVGADCELADKDTAGNIISDNCRALQFLCYDWGRKVGRLFPGCLDRIMANVKAGRIPCRYLDGYAGNGNDLIVEATDRPQGKGLNLVIDRERLAEYFQVPFKSKTDGISKFERFIDQLEGLTRTATITATDMARVAYMVKGSYYIIGRVHDDRQTSFKDWLTYFFDCCGIKDRVPADSNCNPARYKTPSKKVESLASFL